jgi:hypothetical protein
MSAIGSSRQFAATQQFGCSRSEADIVRPIIHLNGAMLNSRARWRRNYFDKCELPLSGTCSYGRMRGEPHSFDSHTRSALWRRRRRLLGLSPWLLWWWRSRHYLAHRDCAHRLSIVWASRRNHLASTVPVKAAGIAKFVAGSPAFGPLEASTAPPLRLALNAVTAGLFHCPSGMQSNA